MEFKNLKIDKEIIEILENNNFARMTPIQKAIIPLITNLHDVMGVSCTGTGKTLSYLVPIIQNLLVKNKSMYCMIITPTRELALQIEKKLDMFKCLGVRSLLVIGGENNESQIEKIKLHPHIVIGTPGRIYKIRTHLQLNRFRVVVFDEADRFFNEDFFEEINYVFDNLRKKCQILFFTATITQNLLKKSEEVMKDCKIINLATETKNKMLNEHYFFVARKFKESFVYCFLNNNKDLKFIIFANMKCTALILSKFLKLMNINNEVLCGDQKQALRQSVLEGYINNSFNVLIATDVGSRGLDICDVNVVINFDVPQNQYDYVHRIGRTARAQKTGTAITLVTQYDIGRYQLLEFYLGKKLDLFVYNANFEQYEEEIENKLFRVKDEIKQEKRVTKENEIERCRTKKEGVRKAQNKKKAKINRLHHIEIEKCFRIN